MDMPLFLETQLAFPSFILRPSTPTTEESATLGCEEGMRPSLGVALARCLAEESTDN